MNEINVVLQVLDGSKLKVPCFKYSELNEWSKLLRGQKRTFVSLHFKTLDELTSYMEDDTRP